MLWQIEIKTKSGISDPIAESKKKEILDFGIKSVKNLKFIQVYYIDTTSNKNSIDKIARFLLSDPITQEYVYSKLLSNKKITFKNTNHTELEITYHKGVMDPWEESIKKGIKSLGIKKVSFIKTAQKYIIADSLTKQEIHTISYKILLNPIIQHIVKNKKDILSKPKKYKFKLKYIEILNLTDKQLINLSTNMQLHLNLREMQAIKKYFKKLKKNPTDIELETIAQTWSEHCKHKTFRSSIEYTEIKGERKKTKNINNLLKDTIMKATKELDKNWCISVFEDNAGIIKFDSKYNICFKVETHNHPSALEPFGGANTGIGGVIRDTLGTGLGSKPIFNTNVFCFANPNFPKNNLPSGILHPKKIMKGVVWGVRDYGNKMGIPTINGAIIFDNDYLGNPLVYCGNVGIMPKEASFKKVNPGDLIILVGGRTGRDGIHGATFSSAQLTENSENTSSQAVQIGNPITEKKTQEAILRSRDENLYNAITDCGAGGLSSAVGELGSKTGACIDLEKVPLKYTGLSYTEIWISEAQERMILAANKKNLERLKQIFKEEEVDLNCIGKFTKDKTLNIFFKDKRVAKLDMNFLHNGIPNIKRKAIWKEKKSTYILIDKPKDISKIFLKLLSRLNIASKECIIRQYDHEVKGISVLKPLMGIENDGPSDASIVKPIYSSNKGIAVSCGINPKYGKIDTYWMAASCIDEAIRQLICVGCNINKIALLDNFCWGNTEDEEKLGDLVRASLSCYKFAKEFKTPFISGKDSLNNEFTIGNKSKSIPPTLLISAIGIVDDISKVISMDLKQEDNLIYILGKTYEELGASEYFNSLNLTNNNIPKVSAKPAKKLYSKLYKAINQHLVMSAHDCSDGGLGICCSEMAFAGGFGMQVFLKKVPYKGEKRDDYILFSETNSRIIVEIKKEKKEQFEKIMQDVEIDLIGYTSKKPLFEIYGLKNNKIISEDIHKLKRIWKKPLNW